MVLYGDTLSEADLAARVANRSKPIPPYDGEIDGQGFWLLAEGNYTYKYGGGIFDPYGNWFSFKNDSEYYIREIHILDRLARAGSTALDIGAFVGSWTIPLLVAGVRVHAFEPDPRYYQDLLCNIQLNKINPENYKCYNCGLYEDDIIADFFDLHNIHFQRLDDILTLDELMFAKIDVEGAELEVLKGGNELFKKHKPNMWIECHTEQDPNIVNKLIDYIGVELEYHGYFVDILTILGATKHMLIARPTIQNRHDHLLRRPTETLVESIMTKQHPYQVFK